MSVEVDKTQLMIAFDFRYIELCIVKNGEMIWRNMSASKLMSLAGVCDWIFDIKDHLRFKHNLLIGRPSAEHIFEVIGSVLPVKPDRIYPVKGRSLITGLPTTVEIGSAEIREIIQSRVRGVFAWLHNFLDIGEYDFESPTGKTITRTIPNTLIKDITKHPIILTGEYATLPGLKELLEQELQLEVIVQEINNEASSNL